MDMLKRLALIPAFFSLSMADVDLKPLIDYSSINGVWEGIAEEEARIFSLNIFENSGTLLIATNSPIDIFEFKIKNLDVTNGRITLDAFSKDTSFCYKVTGEGRGNAAGGVFYAKIQATRNGEAGAIWKSRFYKNGYGYFNFISTADKMFHRIRTKAKSKAK